MTTPDKEREQLVAGLRAMTLTREEITRIRNRAVGRQFVEISTNTLIALTDGARLVPEAATFIEQHCAPEGETDPVGYAEREEIEAKARYFNVSPLASFNDGDNPVAVYLRPSPARERAEVVAWLRTEAERDAWRSDTITWKVVHCCILADAIERGEHLRAAPSPGETGDKS